MSRNRRRGRGEVKFDVGDQVLAKVRGYSFWPARIIRNVSKGRYEVTFYATKQKNILKDNAIVPYSRNNLKYIRMKHYTQELKNAISEIDFAIESSSRESKYSTNAEMENGTQGPSKEDECTMTISDISDYSDYSEDSISFEKFQHFSVEVKIEYLCNDIVNSLDAENPDLQKTAELLDSAQEINFNRLMIKKRSHFVDILEKVSRFYNRKFTREECDVIRFKAYQILDRIRILFDVSEDESFFAVFDLEMEVFKEQVKDLSEFEYNYLMD